MRWSNWKTKKLERLSLCNCVCYCLSLLTALCLALGSGVVSTAA